jgi:tetratricopeptide (TPR) repeat protein
MGEEDEARALIAQQKYREAGSLLERLLLADRDNDELWYLRGILSLKMKNYDAALEFFERAITLNDRSRYHQTKGMAHFESYEMEEAIDEFLLSLEEGPDDALPHFFIALCYMFRDDPRSGEHLKRALAINPKKTKQLLLNFYALFIKDDPRISKAQKARIEQGIRELISASSSSR